LGEQKKREPLGLSLSHFFLYLSELLVNLLKKSVKIFEYYFWFDSELSFTGRAGKEKV